MSYDVIKALHLISVMSWMAGLLYLPRLFVYHAETTIGSVRAETFKVMERRLLKAIMNPAMIASFCSLLRRRSACSLCWASDRESQASDHTNATGRRAWV